jgi:glycosyltransferase involved in cell wall biosynthesis
MAGPPTLDDYKRYGVRRFGADREAGASSSPRVTLITVALNARPTLARTIETVQRQTFPSIEHVVIDGGSTDGTLELLATALRPHDHWISEPDAGISDALNKGVALARGEYLQFIHADDWLSPRQVEQAVESLERSGADFVFGDLVFYEDGKPVFEYRGEPDYRHTITRRMPALNHPTVLMRKECFRHIGLFDLRYKCAMDYDWFLRLHLAGGRGVYDFRIRGHMNHDGISNTDFHRTIREVRAIAVANGYAPMRAHFEAAFQHAKVSAGRWTKAHARPVHDLVRRTINRSFRPLG